MTHKQYQEIGKDLIQDITKLPDEEASKAVESLAGPKKFITGVKGNELMLPIQLQIPSSGKRLAAKALFDSGCTGSCINRDFVEKHEIPTQKTPLPLRVYNADGTLNGSGSITKFVEVRFSIRDHAEIMPLAVTDLGTTDVFIGYEWMKKHNPSVDWEKGTLTLDRCPLSCGYTPHHHRPDDDEDEEDNMETIPLEEGDRIFFLNLKDNQPQVRQVSMVEPDFISEFSDVFSAREFERLPEHRSWDHAIELTDGFKPTDCKVYPLSPSEQDALKKFLEENLAPGRIQTSKSPMASPFFFIKKKDGSLRPVQDYRKLNDMTIKNKYPLPLIQELIDKTQHLRFFTKLDIQWGYNNIRIKEGNE